MCEETSYTHLWSPRRGGADSQSDMAYVGAIIYPIQRAQTGLVSKLFLVLFIAQPIA